MLWGENSGLGKVSAQRDNSAFPTALQQRAQGVDFCPAQKQVIGGGFSSFLSHSHPQHYSGSWGAFSWRRHSRNSPTGREARAEAGGQRRSALGRHDVELPKQAEGLFLGPLNPAARNLRCTLGDPGTRLMVTCSNRQLMASVLGAGAGAGGGKGSALCPHWCDCVLLRLQQLSLNALVVSRAMRMCAQREREEMPADTVQGRWECYQGFAHCKVWVHLFQYRQKKQCNATNTNLHQAIRSPQLCALLCYRLPWLNISFTQSHKSEWIFCCWWSHSPVR